MLTNCAAAHAGRRVCLASTPSACLRRRRNSWPQPESLQSGRLRAEDGPGARRLCGSPLALSWTPRPNAKASFARGEARGHRRKRPARRDQRIGLKQDRRSSQPASRRQMHSIHAPFCMQIVGSFPSPEPYNGTIGRLMARSRQLGDRHNPKDSNPVGGIAWRYLLGSQSSEAKLGYSGRTSA
jgi:hypothetical protein